MLPFIIPAWALRLAASGVLERVLIAAAEILVKRTDSDLDDQILAEIKRALNHA